MSAKVLGKYFWLFVALMCLLALYPLFGPSLQGIIALEAIFLFVLITTIRAISDTRRHMVMATLISIPLFVARFLDYLYDHPVIDGVSYVSSILLEGYATAIILKDILKHKRVSAEQVIGAVDAYLLIGLVWTSLFSLMRYMRPAAFTIQPQGYPTFPELMYFSYSTLSTLGMGDIVPVNPLARSLTALEAIVGQIFLVVLVARLVSLHIAHQEKDGPSA